METITILNLVMIAVNLFFFTILLFQARFINKFSQDLREDTLKLMDLFKESLEKWHSAQQEEKTKKTKKEPKDKQ